MRRERSHWFFWTALLIGVTMLMQLHYTAAVSLGMSDPVSRNHLLYFGEYRGAKGRMRKTEEGTAASRTARYVQLSNGSRFVCETTDFQHHDPPSSVGFPLAMSVKAVIDSIKQSGLPCTHVVDEHHSIVLCWDQEVRVDAVLQQTTRVLGRRRPADPRHYWNSRDTFGPYVATVYGNGDECPYEKRPTETEIRFYCRYTELENPMPFMTLHEASQCRFVLRAMSSKFCYIPQLDHAVETETVHCRMLE